MKKLIVLLSLLTCIIGYGQTYDPIYKQNIKYTGIVRFDQPVRQNGTDTLATKKYARGLISMPDTVTKVATKYDISKKLDINGNGSQLTGLTKTQVGLSNVDNTSDANKPISTATQTALNSKQDTLPATPINPQSKFLNGNKQWSEIVAGSGGYAANVYPTTIASDISGYYKLSYTNEATQTIRSYTVTNQELQVNTSIYDAGIGVTTIDAGIWLARMRMYVSSASGNTHSRAEVFLRHADGTETTLFSTSSSDINNTTADWVISESNQPQFSCLTTDRLGIRHFVSTDSHSDVTVYVVIGNGYASYINTPLALRHTQLRGLNDDSNYQHITSTQVSGLHTHSNKSALDLVSGINNGDETLSTIKAKLGAVTSSSDGYLTYGQYNTLSAKQDALGYTPINSTAIGAANGVAPLDASAKISTAYLPSVVLGAMKYQGTYDASTGSYPSSPSQGNYWVVSVAGTISSVSYKVGDWMAYNGTGWNKIDNQQTVSSVFGRTGAVSAVSGDYNSDQVTEGATNKYYTDTRSRAALTLTNSGSGASTYNQYTGVLNIPTYSNQNITLSGDVTGSGATSISTTLANSGVTAGTYNNSATSITPITFDAKGRATGTGSAVTITPAWSSITGKPTIVSTEVDPVYSASSWASTTNNSSAWNTAYSWGNHASAGYALSNGSNSSGTWGINISGTAANTSKWDNINSGLSDVAQSNGISSLIGQHTNGYAYRFNSTAVQSWLGLGSLAYQYPSGAGAGKVLTATDASGNCTWQTPGYSSGTWTPVYGSGEYTFTTDGTATYTKINNIIHLSFTANTATNASSYIFYVTLPFGITTANLSAATCIAYKSGGGTSLGKVSVSDDDQKLLVYVMTAPTGAGIGTSFSVQVDYIYP